MDSRISDSSLPNRFAPAYRVLSRIFAVVTQTDEKEAAKLLNMWGHMQQLEPDELEKPVHQLIS